MLRIKLDRWGKSKSFDEELYDKIEESSLNKIREFHYNIYGYDKAPSAMRKARENSIMKRLLATSQN